MINQGNGSFILTDGDSPVAAICKSMYTAPGPAPAKDEFMKEGRTEVLLSASTAQQRPSSMIEFS